MHSQTRDSNISQSKTLNITYMAWSKYQERIFDFVQNKKGSAVVSAVAGSGKTTTIVECAKRIPSNKRVLFLAFNNPIAKELSDRLNEYKNVQCKTLHALGFSAIARAYKGTNLKVEKDKWDNYIKDNISFLSSYITEETTDIDKKQYINNICNLLEKCRVNLVRHDEVYLIKKLAYHHNILLIADEVEVVANLLELVYTPNKKGIIDFVDMITLPCVCEPIKRNIFRFDFVFIDECQDLNKAQRELMLSAVNFAWGGRFIAVGDRKQAINGFCGAGCDSFDLLAKCAKGNELPLSVNYRCGKEIIKLAKDIVPQIEAHEGAEEGKVEYLTDLKGIKTNDMILCRSSAPLISLCLKMLANNIPSYVKGTELGENLIKLIDKQKAKNFKSLNEKLQKELIKIRQKAIKEGVREEEVEDSKQVISFKDKINCINAFADECEGIADMKRKMANVFSDVKKNNAVCLSTVHKSKGLEADRVFIVLPHKLPLTWQGQKDWEYEQEMNLKYVAFTRAKKYLGIVTLDDDALATYQFNEKTK